MILGTFEHLCYPGCMMHVLCGALMAQFRSVVGHTLGVLNGRNLLVCQRSVVACPLQLLVHSLRWYQVELSWTSLLAHKLSKGEHSQCLGASMLFFICWISYSCYSLPFHMVSILWIPIIWNCYCFIIMTSNFSTWFTRGEHEKQLETSRSNFFMQVLT